MEEKKAAVKPKGTALIPFLVFVLVYLGAALFMQARGVEMAFYQLPAPVAVIAGIVVAFIMFKGTLTEKVDQFVKGCGDSNIMIMCCIYLLAGGFAGVARAMGGVEATANLGLSIIPPQYITPGLFIIAMFLSLATGTSVGTIGAIGPIAVEVSLIAGLNMTWVMAAIVGGAMFGDNLSMISDTTIAATRTQGVKMNDKFKVNILIALPAAIITFILLLLDKPGEVMPLENLQYSIIKVFPYILVLILALLGVNVFLTLFLGIVSALVVGVAGGAFTFLTGLNSMYDGFAGMFEIFLLAMFTGGLSRMVAENGGIAWILVKIQKLIRGRKSAEIGISALVSLTDIATANNTVAIVISGPVAKEMSQKYKVDPRRVASLLDTWSCVWQGILPYGAQVLVACSLTAGVVNPVGMIPRLWYPLLLGIFALASIFVPFTNFFIRKKPWNWDEGAEEVPE